MDWCGGKSSRTDKGSDKRQPALNRRLVSLFDPGARPIRKGKSHKDTEFGRKLLIGETDHCIISTYEVLAENPCDVTLLQTGVKGHRHLFRRRLKAVAGDRGLYSRNNEDWLRNTGVRQISIPARGKIGKERRQYQR